MSKSTCCQLWEFCNGKRIKISPADLDMMRDEFAKNLTDLGYKATNFSYKNKKFSLLGLIFVIFILSTLK